MDRALPRLVEWMETEPSKFARSSQVAASAARASQNAVYMALAQWFRGPLERNDWSRLQRMASFVRAWHYRLDRPRAADWACAISAMSPAVQPLRTVRASAFRSIGAGSDGAIVYVHGGSFVAERSPRITALIARIAAAAQLPVIAIDYRIAPEHACPAAVEDVERGIVELAGGGIPPDRIAIAAESAGAGIALAAMTRLLQIGGPVDNAWSCRRSRRPRRGAG